MRINELIKELKIYQKELPSGDVVFVFDGLETEIFDISLEKNKILIDLDYLNILEDDDY
jgi:hypothetical protein